MNHIFNNKKIILYYILCTTVILLLSGCSQNEEIEQGNDQEMAVPIEINVEGLIEAKALGDPTHTVNRILILPFKKTDESLANDDANFLPDYTTSRQIDINAFPTYVTKLNLTSTSTYKILVIGYNRTDYDSGSPTSPSRRFSIGSVTSPTTLSNIHLQPMVPTIVPEFFTGVGTAYLGSASVGQYFKPTQMNNLKANITRVVSGLSVNLTNIPAYVTSVTLVADQLVKAIKPIGSIATVWQTSGDAESKRINTQIPVLGAVSFNNFLLPTLDLHKTKLFLDISYAGITERYTIKVPDQAGISSTNSITFTPNQVVKITGSYANINIGFTLSNSINLDDNAWDGIQTVN